MTRRPKARFVPHPLALEGRELLTAAALRAHAAHIQEVRAAAVARREIMLSSPVVTSLNLRLNLSQQITARVNEAFQAFLYNYLGQSITLPGSNTALGNKIGSAAGTGAGNGGGGIGNPGGNGSGSTTNAGGAGRSSSGPSGSGSGAGGATGTVGGIGTGTGLGSGSSTTAPTTTPANPAIPIGTIPNPPTLANYIAQMTTQVDNALRTFQINDNRPQPSVQASIRVSPLADRALVPFANRQLAQLEAAIVAHPPQFAADGTITNPEPLAALNSSYNAILNAIAEFSVHPNLFTSPSDFYINPTVTFPLSFTGVPASSGSGFFILGPGGVPLPGAPRSSHA